MKIENAIVAVEKELKEAAEDTGGENIKDTDQLLDKSEKGELKQVENAATKEQTKEQTNEQKNGETAKPEKLFSKIKPPPTFDAFLRYVIVFGLIMFYFYLADYKKVSMDVFAKLF